jgi:hypothetical protein
MGPIPKSTPVTTWRLPPHLAADEGNTDDNEGSCLTSIRFNTRAQYGVERVSTDPKAEFSFEQA